MEYTFGILIIFTVLSGGQSQIHDQACQQKELDACMSLIQPILDRKNLSYATNLDQLNAACRQFDNGLKCVDNYVASCFNPSQQNVFGTTLEGAREAMILLCQDENYQQEYLKHIKCYESISSRYQRCWIAFQTSIEHSSSGASNSDEQRIGMCRALHVYLNCTDNTTQTYCDSEAAKFIAIFSEKAVGSAERSKCGIKSANNLTFHIDSPFYPTAMAPITVESSFINQPISIPQDINFKDLQTGYFPIISSFTIMSSSTKIVPNVHLEGTKGQLFTDVTDPFLLHDENLSTPKATLAINRGIYTTGSMIIASVSLDNYIITSDSKIQPTRTSEIKTDYSQLISFIKSTSSFGVFETTPSVISDLNVPTYRNEGYLSSTERKESKNDDVNLFTLTTITEGITESIANHQMESKSDKPDYNDKKDSLPVASLNRRVNLTNDLTEDNVISNSKQDNSISHNYVSSKNSGHIIAISFFIICITLTLVLL